MTIEPTDTIIRDRAGRDDELPIGGLGQEQLTRRLGEDRARGGVGEGGGGDFPERVLQTMEPRPYTISTLGMTK